MTGSREAAFVHAITSAALVHSVTKSRSSGLLSKYTYGDSRNADLCQLGTMWGNCSNALNYGLWLSKTFADPVADGRQLSKKKMEIIAAHIHNNAVGRMVSPIVSS